MTDPINRVGAGLFQARIGQGAAAALTADFARHPGPKHALLIGVEPGSPVLTEAVDALGAKDQLTVVAGEAVAEVRDWAERFGDWAADRITVIANLTDARSADAVIVAEIVTGGADEVRTQLETLARLVAPGGVLNVAVAAAPFLAGGAGEELTRQSSLYSVGDDLVVRNMPPVRVHRLRFSAAETTLAQRLAPLERTSSVRLMPGMSIDSNGVAAAGICLGAALLAKKVAPRSGLWLLPALAAAPVAAFFRDPDRRVPEDPTAVVAASDGKVLGVERLTDERLGTAEFLRISVFLSVLDVHINRAPVAGRVVDQFVVDGGYAAAMKPEAEHNVAAYTLLETVHGQVAVVQRTGLIARRIVHRAPVGALLAKGERFGLIRFGSRTDVYLPVDAAVAEVAAGDRVLGGETVIARWR